eukprot:scaffold105475_cov21-Tisochrysis_lutea.AAC.1
MNTASVPKREGVPGEGRQHSEGDYRRTIHSFCWLPRQKQSPVVLHLSKLSATMLTSALLSLVCACVHSPGSLCQDA